MLTITGTGKKLKEHPWTGDAYNQMVKEVVLPDGLMLIGYSSFEGCINLTKVTIPEGVTKIEGKAFKDTGITSITLPKSLKGIGDQAFEHTPLNSLIIPDGVTSLGYFIINGC